MSGGPSTLLLAVCQALRGISKQMGLETSIRPVVATLPCPAHNPPPSLLVHAIPVAPKPCAYEGTGVTSKGVALYAVSPGLAKFHVFRLDFHNSWSSLPHGVPRDPVRWGGQCTDLVPFPLRLPIALLLVHFQNFLFQMPAANRRSSHAYERRQ